MLSKKIILFLSISLFALAIPLSAQTLTLEGGGFGLDFTTLTGDFEFIAPTSNTVFEITATNNNTYVLVPLSTGPAFTGSLLNYPNPFSISSGTQIGYELTGDMDIELRIYSLTGYQVFSQLYFSGQEGATGHYNKVSINMSTLGRALPPGVYIYAIFNKGRLLAKNKMVVKP